MCGADPESFRILGRRLDTHQGLRPRKRRGIAVTVLRCRRCGLVFSDPLPLPQRIEEHYDVRPEEYWTEDRLEIPEDYFGSQIATAKRLLDVSSPIRALDVGAGIGRGMAAMEAAGFEAYGLEPSPAFRDFGLSKLGLSEDRFLLDCLETARFPQGSFHFVNFGAVLEHLPDPDGAIRQVLDWLVPGGVFHVEVPSAHWLLARLLRRYYRVVGTDFVSNLSPMHPPYHLYEFEDRTFTRHAEEVGYAIEHLEKMVGEVYVPGIVIPIFRMIMRVSGTGMLLQIWGRKRE